MINILNQNMSKKLVFSFTLPLFLAASFFATSAQATSLNTVIRGNAYNNGSPVNNLAVSITCVDHNVTYSTTAHTDGNGLYEITVPISSCTKGDSTTQKATYNGVTLTDNELVSNDPQFNGVSYLATGDFNFSVASVPEFGTLTGMVALLGSVGAFVFFRRKNLI